MRDIAYPSKLYSVAMLAFLSTLPRTTFGDRLQDGECVRTNTSVNFFLMIAIGLFAASFQTFAAGTEVRIRTSPPLMKGSSLGFSGYQRLEDEGEFFDKITEKEILFQTPAVPIKPPQVSEEDWAKSEKERHTREKAMIPSEKYRLLNQTGAYVGWFGIVRTLEYDIARDLTLALVEHKYFDGKTDLNLHVVSLYGAGDFQLVIPGKISPEQIRKLSLIRVYGKVSKGDKGLPVIQAEYIRVWDWKLFTFADYGPDRSNPEWIKLRKFSGEEIYSGQPSEKYYEDRIGKREPLDN